MSPGFTSSAPPRLRSSIVIAWLAPANDRSTDDRLAHHLVERDLRGGDAVLEDVQG